MSFFLSAPEVAALGLAAFGSNVSIDRDARLINPGAIHLGHNVRIDAQVILSAGRDGIMIGNHVHISAGALLYGGGGAIALHDYSVVSGRAIIYTMTDILGHVHSWCVPDELKAVERGDVTLHRHAAIAAGAIVLPGVVIGTGAVVGPLSLLRQDVPEMATAFGVPARILSKRRDRALLEQELREIVRRFPYLDSPPRDTPPEDGRS
jgi:dTDP-4-amino-4,6-dideoxy-D-glucose acyltransferase